MVDMAKLDDVALMDGIAQAELIRSRQIQPIELVDAAIARIELLNPILNAVITPMYEQARVLAFEGLPDGPFSGVPFLLKDLIATYAGVRMTGGSRYLMDFIPDHDSELVARLKRSGLIVVGKTNTPELGLSSTTEPVVFGPCRNPWDVNRSTGGSSGGSAAAVASGMVPMAHAGDAGGSIRIPASCCGVFGLKPTRARNPLGPDFGDLRSGFVCEHAITRSVRDSAALLDVTCGPDLGDPYWAPPRLQPFFEEVGVDPGKLNIAFTTATANGKPVHPVCIEAVRDTVQLCSELGHNVVEDWPTMDVDVIGEAFGTMFSATCASSIDWFASQTGRVPSVDGFEPSTWIMYEMGKAQSVSDYPAAVMKLQKISRDVARFFTRYDIWLTPSLAEPPVPIGAFDSPEDPWQGMIRAGEFTPFTGMANFTGQPAMSVPLFWSKEGLPIGTQFVGRFGDEATLFRLASQIESARPWADRWPPNID